MTVKISMNVHLIPTSARVVDASIPKAPIGVSVMKALYPAEMGNSVLIVVKASASDSSSVVCAQPQATVLSRYDKHPYEYIRCSFFAELIDVNFS